MKVRVIVEGTIDVEMSRGAVELLAVRKGLVQTKAEPGTEEEEANYDALFTDLEGLMPAISGATLEVQNFTTICRKCGCTELQACPGGCSWVEIDLCSTCAEGAPVNVDSNGDAVPA